MDQQFPASGSVKENVAEILGLGFDINVIDIFGHTPLAVFCQSLGYALHLGRATALREQEVLTFLLQNGSDPNIGPRGQLPIFQKLYRCHCFGFCSQNQTQEHGSYCEDLLDSALSICGKNILKFRPRCQRRAKYTRYYTREIFQTLWDGREDACPYWDDTPWPKSTNGSDDGLLCQCCTDKVD